MNVMRGSSVVVLALLVAAGALAAPTPTAAQVPAALGSANPELVGALAKELGATTQQAEGAAGALFGLAKSRLKPEEFSRVAAGVPGMDKLLQAAPVDAGAGAAATLSQAVGGSSRLGGLAGVAGAFTQLGLKPDMALKAVPVLTKYVTKTGGAGAGNLLAGVLK